MLLHMFVSSINTRQAKVIFFTSTQSSKNHIAMKVVVLLFLAMLVVLTQHKALAGPLCPLQCLTSSSSSRDEIINCLMKCGALCPIDCAFHFTDFLQLGKCVWNCVTSVQTNEVQILNPATTVCNVGCSFGLCSKFLDENNHDKFGSCMTSCSENYCVGGNIALEKA